MTRVAYHACAEEAPPHVIYDLSSHQRLLFE
jgi:hypothetical protein